jgi:hypothetical protein
MAAVYQTEKNIFTEADFEQMSWHDCPIHALSFTDDYQLLLDIDYIFEWVLMSNKKRYQFWIAPCTLIFENVYEIALESNHTTLIIDSVTKDNPQRPKNAEYLNKDLEYDWLIETTVGEISFKSVGYNQYVRKEPVLLRSQKLDLQNRGGVSFGTSFFPQS